VGRQRGTVGVEHGLRAGGVAERQQCLHAKQLATAM
jgi:hypothetical protein